MLQEFFVEFPDLFVPDALQLLDPSSITFLDKELFVDLLDPDRREADLVVQGRIRGELATFITHLEHQAQEDSQLHARMFRYFARFHDRYAVPVYPIALCSYRTPRRVAPDRYMLAFPAFDVLNFRFRVIQLNQFRWRDFLAHPNPLATALLARMQVASHERLTVKGACLSHLLGLPLSAKRRRVIGQFLDVYLPLQPDEEAQLEAEVPEATQQQREEAMTGIVTSWERRGAAKILIKGLDARFGPLNEEIQRTILSYPFETLEALSIAQASFHSLDDLKAWLAANPVPPWVDPLGESDEDEASE